LTRSLGYKVELNDVAYNDIIVNQSEAYYLQTILIGRYTS